jgi:cell division transport system ATP-binding protein
VTVPIGERYIDFHNVEVRYSDLVYGLRGVSLTIARGEFVFFVGKTGSGKSTLLKSLTREAKHTAGRVVLEGRELSTVKPWEIPTLRRKMGIVPQDFVLLPKKKVWENVGYAMRAIGATKREVRKRVPEILEMVHIGHRADAFPHELSGGEQQRVAIARSLINDPPLLIADEPTGNLDFEHSMGIMELLAQLNARGTTVLVASHDLHVIEKMERRIVRMEDGRIAEDIRPNLVLGVGEQTPNLFETAVVGAAREQESTANREAVDA